MRIDRAASKVCPPERSRAGCVHHDIEFMANHLLHGSLVAGSIFPDELAIWRMRSARYLLRSKKALGVPFLWVAPHNDKITRSFEISEEGLYGV